MLAEVFRFDRQFDATYMTHKEITDEVRARGWSSFEIDTHRALHGDGRLIVTRLSSARLNRGC